MTDPKEIEGTPERAAMKGRQEDLGFSMSARPSLGNPDVVRDLMSAFGTDIVEARKQYNAGDIDSAAAQKRVRELARQYGDIIMGRGSDYEALPWNDPERLGRRIRLVVPPVEGVEDPGELLFLTIGTSLTSLAAAHEAGRIDDKGGEASTREMLEDAADLIVGVR